MALSPHLEDLDPHIPAIQVLHSLGWKYLSREEAVWLRNGRLDQVVLTGVLKPWLEQNNRFEVKGESHPFSEANIAEAIRRLLDEPYDGLVRTNEKIYHLLTLGTSLDQTVEGDRKGRQLHYVDNAGTPGRVERRPGQDPQGIGGLDAHTDGLEGGGRRRLAGASGVVRLQPGVQVGGDADVALVWCDSR
jgi:hypothetical protein